MTDGIRVYIDWNRDGTFTGTYDQITVDTRGNTGISLEYGRDQTTALSPVVGGQGGLVIDNSSRRYSPRNASSPLFGLLKPARPVRIEREVLGVTYVLFSGHTDTAPINPNISDKTISTGLLDGLSDFRGTKIHTPLFQGVRTGDAIGYVLDAIGWTGGRDLDSGATYIPYWWEDDTDALDALDKLVRSEGPPALLTMGSDGEVVFRDRHHRITDANTLTSQGTWRGTGSAEPVMGVPFTCDEAWQNIINDAKVSVDVRVGGNIPTVVWESQGLITLSDGQSVLIDAQSGDPFVNAVVPVDGIDFNSTGTVSVSLNRTSGQSVGILLTAIGGTATVDALMLRASAIPVAYTVLISSQDSQSVLDYGSRGFPSDLPWCSRYDAQAVIDLAVASRAQPLTVVSARFVVGRNTSRAAATLSRNLSDLITIVEPESQLNGTFYIERIAHSFTGTEDHDITFGLEAAPTAVSPLLRFDTAGAGFNDGKFGAGGDSAANVFRFDGTSGHRFNEGVFAT